MGCPQCGSEILSSVAVHYDEEVRKPGADPIELAPFAPPTKRASIWGFALAVWIWIMILTPAFAWEAPRRVLILIVLGQAFVCLLPLVLFLWARKRDRALTAEYDARKFCDHCGWYER